MTNIDRAVHILADAFRPVYRLGDIHTHITKEAGE